jgi:hypothetical protein
VPPCRDSKFIADIDGRAGKRAKLPAAGQPMIVRRAAVESALWWRDRPPRPVRLPLDRSVRFVQVGPNDRIGPARDRELGGAVGDGELGVEDRHKSVADLE